MTVFSLKEPKRVTISVSIITHFNYVLDRDDDYDLYIYLISGKAERINFLKKDKEKMLKVMDDLEEMMRKAQPFPFIPVQKKIRSGDSDFRRSGSSDDDGSSSGFSMDKAVF